MKFLKKISSEREKLQNLLKFIFNFSSEFVEIETCSKKFTSIHCPHTVINVIKFPIKRKSKEEGGKVDMNLFIFIQINYKNEKFTT